MGNIQHLFDPEAQIVFLKIGTNFKPAETSNLVFNMIHTFVLPCDKFFHHSSHFGLKLRFKYHKNSFLNGKLS